MWSWDFIVIFICFKSYCLVYSSRYRQISNTDAMFLSHHVTEATKVLVVQWLLKFVSKLAGICSLFMSGVHKPEELFHLHSCFWNLKFVDNTNYLRSRVGSQVVPGRRWSTCLVVNRRWLIQKYGNMFLTDWLHSNRHFYTIGCHFVFPRPEINLEVCLILLLACTFLLGFVRMR